MVTTIPRSHRTQRTDGTKREVELVQQSSKGIYSDVFTVLCPFSVHLVFPFNVLLFVHRKDLQPRLRRAIHWHGGIAYGRLPSVLGVGETASHPYLARPISESLVRDYPFCRVT